MAAVQGVHPQSLQPDDLGSRPQSKLKREVDALATCRHLMAGGFNRGHVAWLTLSPHSWQHSLQLSIEKIKKRSHQIYGLFIFAPILYTGTLVSQSNFKIQIS